MIIMLYMYVDLKLLIFSYVKIVQSAFIYI